MRNIKFGLVLIQILMYNNNDRAWEVKNPTSISEYYNSPTETYEEAIKYCLTKLI